MRHTARWTAGILAVLTVAVVATWNAPGVRADDAKVGGDLKKMQGTWVRDGDEGPDVKWTVDGDKVNVEVNGTEYKCMLTVDSKATPHSSADLKITEGPGDSAGKTSKAIYKLDGDKLVFCVTHPGIEARPTEFKPVENEVVLFKLKKDK